MGGDIVILYIKINRPELTGQVLAHLPFVFEVTIRAVNFARVKWAHRMFEYIIWRTLTQDSVGSSMSTSLCVWELGYVVMRAEEEEEEAIILHLLSSHLISIHLM